MILLAFLPLGRSQLLSYHATSSAVDQGADGWEMRSALAPNRGEPVEINPSNFALARLASADMALLAPHLEYTALPLRKVLETRERKLSAVYFIESGFASVVGRARQASIEVGVIGREGMTGLAALFGADTSFCQVYMQSKGNGFCIRAKILREATDVSVTLHRSLLTHAYAFMNQIMRTAASNGRNKIDERLARWLLMAADRLDTNELSVTHEFLAMMLGVQRPGVSTAIQELERQGVLSRKRGLLVIENRRSLEQVSNGAYTKADAL